MKYGERISKHLFSLLSLCIMTCIAISCIENDNSTECVKDFNRNFSEDSLLNEILHYKSIWECNNISHYRIDIEIETQVCFGVVFQLEVEDNEIISSSVLSSVFGENHENLIPHCGFYSIDSLFSLIIVAVDSDLPFPDYIDELNKFNPNVAYSVRLMYNDQLGYPEQGYIDYVFGIADEEFGFKIIEFEMFN